jgi:hypothetical protein
VQHEAVAGEGNVNFDFEDLNLEDVSHLGFFDCNWPGENVAARPFVCGGVVLVDLVVIRRNLVGLYAPGNEVVAGAAGGEGLDRRDVDRKGRSRQF